MFTTILVTYFVIRVKVLYKLCIVSCKVLQWRSILLTRTKHSPVEEGLPHTFVVNIKEWILQHCGWFTV